MASGSSETVMSLPEAPCRPAGAPTALDGLTVVDFSHFIAGPFATMLLADFGARVIKIESPGKGDEFRYFEPLQSSMPTQGSPFLFANRNKRSVALDLKNRQALDVAKELIARSDVLVENFSTGVMDRLGLGYEECKKLNPRLIYCSVPAYSRTGQFADRGGFDTVAQAEIGMISLNGYPDRDGVRAPAPIMDMATAMMVCNTVLAAIVARSKTGSGQYCEVSLFDSAMAMMGYAPLQYLLGGFIPDRDGTLSADTCPSGMFGASDGAFYLIAGSDSAFKRLMLDALYRPDLLDDPRFCDRASRMTHRSVLMRVLADLFRKNTVSHLSAAFRTAGVPCGAVRSLPEALISEEVSSRQLVTRVRLANGTWVPNITPPSKLSDTPIVDPVAAPALGEHTAEVLREVLGYDDARLANLAKSGAIGQGPPVASSS